jgi:hypothetical protein
MKKSNDVSKGHEWTRPANSFHAGILLGLFDPEDVGDKFLRNVGWLLAGYTALHDRR